MSSAKGPSAFASLGAAALALFTSAAAPKPPPDTAIDTSSGSSINPPSTAVPDSTTASHDAIACDNRALDETETRQQGDDDSCGIVLCDGDAGGDQAANDDTRIQDQTQARTVQESSNDGDDDDQQEGQRQENAHHVVSGTNAHQVSGTKTQLEDSTGTLNARHQSSSDTPNTLANHNSSSSNSNSSSRARVLSQHDSMATALTEYEGEMEDEADVIAMGDAVSIGNAVSGADVGAEHDLLNSLELTPNNPRPRTQSELWSPSAMDRIALRGQQWFENSDDYSGAGML
jgi:hypothetical protein